jgi:hypothetical protein
VSEFATRAEVSHVGWGGAKIFRCGFGRVRAAVGHRGARSVVRLDRPGREPIVAIPERGSSEIARLFCLAPLLPGLRLKVTPVGRLDMGTSEAEGKG